MRLDLSLTYLSGLCGMMRGSNWKHEKWRAKKMKKRQRLIRMSNDGKEETGIPRRVAISSCFLLSSNLMAQSSPICAASLLRLRHPCCCHFSMSAVLQRVTTVAACSLQTCIVCFVLVPALSPCHCICALWIPQARRHIQSICSADEASSFRRRTLQRRKHRFRNAHLDFVIW